MNRKNRIIFCIVAIIVICISLIGFTYGYYYTNIIGNTSEKSVSLNLVNLKMKYDNGSGNIEAYNIVPGEVIVSKTFSVENIGTYDISNYVIYLEDVTNTFSRKDDIVLTLTCKTKDGDICNGNEIVYPDNDEILVVSDLKVGERHDYKVEIEYIETYVDQSEDKNSSFTGNIVVKDIRETDSKMLQSIGTNYVKLENVKGIKNIKLYGNSIQDGTPTLETPIEIESVGDKTKNLFDPKMNFSGSVTTNGITITYLEDEDLYELNGTAIKTVRLTERYINVPIEYGTKVSLSAKYISGDFIQAEGETHPALGYFGASDTPDSRVNFATITLDEIDTVRENITCNYNYISAFWFYVYAGQTFENYKVKIQLEEGSEATEYKPYGKYEIPIEIRGKNLNDNTKWIIGDNNNGFVDKADENIKFISNNDEIHITKASAWTGLGSEMFEVNKLKTLTFQVNQDSVVNDYINYHIVIQFYNESKEKTTNKSLLAGKFLSNTLYVFDSSDISIPSTAKYFRLCILTRAALTDLILTNVMISDFENDNYESYQEPITEYININEPLRCIDNTNLENCDYIDLSNGSVVRKVGSVDMGNLNWVTNVFDGRFWTNLGGNILYPENSSVMSKILSSAYTSIPYQKYGSKDDVIYSADSTKLVYVKDTDYTDVTAFKNAVSGKELLYTFANKEEEKIDMDTFSKIKGTNIINVGTSIAPSNFVVDYYS